MHRIATVLLISSDSYNIARDRATSNFDQRHLLNVSYVYDLPFFKKPGLAHTALGGWQWSGIVAFSTGIPLNITNGTDFGDNAGVGNGGGGTGSYPDLVGNPRANIPPPEPGHFEQRCRFLQYNPAAYARAHRVDFRKRGAKLPASIPTAPTSTWLSSSTLRLKRAWPLSSGSKPSTFSITASGLPLRYHEGLMTPSDGFLEIGRRSPRSHSAARREVHLLTVDSNLNDKPGLARGRVSFFNGCRRHTGGAALQAKRGISRGAHDNPLCKRSLSPKHRPFSTARCDI